MIPFFGEKSRITELINVDSDYYIDENYGYFLVDASDGDVIIYVPDLLKERTYSVSKRDSSGNNVTLNFGENTCNGSSTQVINNQYDTITFTAGKNDWVII